MLGRFVYEMKFKFVKEDNPIFKVYSDLFFRGGGSRRVSLGVSDTRGRDARPDRLFQLAK